LQDRIGCVVSDGRLRATQSAKAAVISSGISLIYVGTPKDSAEGVSLEAVANVMAQIGFALRSKPSPHAVVMRSTVPPRTTQERLAPALQAVSGRSIGHDLEFCCNPEFLREGFI
jgi:GDP-mannose 6-dehydrogenase